MRPAVQHILDAITGAAAFVRNDRLDVLAGNQLGLALYSEMFVSPVRPVNTARFVFLDPRARDLYVDWERSAPAMSSPSCAPPPAATPTTATCRISSGSCQRRASCSAPTGRRTTSASTSAVSSASTTPSSAISASTSSGSSSAPTRGLTIFTYTAEPGSRDEEALQLLGSWAATTA